MSIQSFFKQHPVKLILFFNALIWLGLILPATENLRYYQNRHRAIERRLLDMKKLKMNIQRHIQLSKRHQKSINKQKPVFQGTPETFKQDLDQFRSTMGIDLLETKEIEINDPVIPLKKVKIVQNLVGNYSQLVNFLDKIHLLKQTYHIDSLELNSKEDLIPNPQIEMKLVITFFHQSP